MPVARALNAEQNATASSPTLSRKRTVSLSGLEGSLKSKVRGTWSPTRGYLDPVGSRSRPVSLWGPTGPVAQPPQRLLWITDA